MKLYATTTSQRATSGQGGDYLDIRITDEDKEILATLKVYTAEAYNADYMLIYTARGQKSFRQLADRIGKTTKTKGEKQKV
jgi:cell fate regulator YaaT (PSP1 superfamily)